MIYGIVGWLYLSGYPRTINEIYNDGIITNDEITSKSDWWSAKCPI